MSQETQPLQQEPDSISTLFSKKYTEWSEGNLGQICEHYRKIRSTFNEVPVKKSAAAKPTKPAPVLDTDILAGLLDHVNIPTNN